MPELTLQDAYELAVRHHRAGELEQAESLYRQILAVAPDHPNARVDLGTALRQQGRFEEALVELERVMSARPDLPEVHAAMGNFHLARRDFAPAAAAFRRALDLLPGFAIARNNLGRALQEMGDVDGAIAEYQRVLRLEATFADAHLNLGTAYWEKGLFSEAGREYERALALQPADSRTRMNLGLLWLLDGDFARGWEAFEARREGIADKFTPPAGQPLWDGSPLNGRTILLHNEQGLGDTIQFIRYAPMVASRRGRVVVRCQTELVRLLNGQLGIDQVIGPDVPLPAFDGYCPLPSLPRIFATDQSTIPAGVPYLSPDSTIVSRWQRRLSESGGKLNVGFVWAGNPANPSDRRRSLHLSALSILSRMPGIRWVTLQKGPAAEQAKTAAGELDLIDWTAELHDLADTAALVASLDLVISVDTAVAHLAGALGKPVWVLIPFVPDWRWMLGRPDSPWYPTMRLFRQSEVGNWKQPIEQIAGELNHLVL
ncbi:MAG TPA: tetratricopeptide repeat-containing glycosyltransferase family protein [Tepidisphaeraceae bacterium]|nr:tetratricopeptide repeat-containing glycosyltransferase family protein [Tepidisphaeraceae bacterium]